MFSSREKDIFVYGEYAFLVIQCLFVVCIVFKINYFYRHRETTSTFTVYILAIITVSLTLGICEAVLVIMGS